MCQVNRTQQFYEQTNRILIVRHFRISKAQEGSSRFGKSQAESSAGACAAGKRRAVGLELLTLVPLRCSMWLDINKRLVYLARSKHDRYV